MREEKQFQSRTITLGVFVVDSFEFEDRIELLFLSVIVGNDGLGKGFDITGRSGTTSIKNKIHFQKELNILFLLGGGRGGDS